MHIPKTPSGLLTVITDHIKIPNQAGPDSMDAKYDNITSTPVTASNNTPNTPQTSTNTPATTSSKSTIPPIPQTSNGPEKAVVLITGANQGLGFYTAQQLAATGRYHVVVGARSPQKAQEAIKSLSSSTGIPHTSFSPLTIDLTSDASIQMAQLFVHSSFGRLDILINNAGIGSSTLNQGGSLREQYFEIFNTNVFGTASVIDAFMPLLRKSKYPQKRIVNVSSGVGSLGYAQDEACPYNAEKMTARIYRSTKSVLNMLTVVDAAQLKKEGIDVVSVCPGHLMPNSNGNTGLKEPEDGARAVVRAVTAEGVNGKFVTDDDASGFFPW